MPVAGTLSRGCVLFVLSACAGETGGVTERATAVVRDSAGVRIVENRAVDDAAPLLRLTAEPLVQIGSVEGAPEYQLYRVMAVARLSDGSIAVANMGSHEVRFYNAAGRHLHSAGGEGSGPGEFRAISYMRTLAGDTLLVFDFGNRRLSLLAPDGTHVRDYAPRLPAGQSLQRVMAALPDSTLLTLGTAAPPSRSADLGRDSVPFLILEPSGVAHDTRVYPASDRRIRVNESGGRVTSIQVAPVPFSRAVHTAAAGDAFYIGADETFEIHRYGAGGALTTIIRRTDVLPQPVTDDLLARHIDRELAQNRQAPGGPPGAGADPQVLRQRLLTAPRIAALPSYDALAAAADGSFWVRHYVPPGDTAEVTRWSVFDSDGRMTGTLEAPAGFQPMYIDATAVVGVARDDLDVEYVRVYGIEPVAA